jgi:hypothetical protein
LIAYMPRPRHHMDLTGVRKNGGPGGSTRTGGALDAGRLPQAQASSRRRRVTGCWCWTCGRTCHPVQSGVRDEG